MNGKNIILIGSLILIFGLLNLSFSSIGQIAGPLNFNVSIGGTQSQTLTIINSGDEPINYSSTPTVTTLIPNATMPQITINPSNGIVEPHGRVCLNVTVYMPGNKNKPGMKWQGYVSTVELTTMSMVGGANIQAGVLKMMAITAAPPKIPIMLYAGIAIAVAIVVIAIVAYYLKKRGKKKAGAVAARASKRAKKPAGKRKAAGKKGARRKKAARRKR
jgi:hypothetical protein